MKNVIYVFICWLTLALLYMGMEALVGKYWVIGIIPSAFIGYVVFVELDKILEEYL